MTFVLVGGGPTGVELAGALGEIANDTLRSDFRSIRPQDARIELIEAVDRILPMYPPDRSASAAAQLARLGVTVRTRTRVVDIGDAYVRVEDEHGSETIGARTVLWAAGVLAASFGRAVAEAVGAETDRSGRIVVGEDLAIAGHPEILVVGDAAVQPWKDGKAVPGVAQGGIQGGKHAGRVVLARLRGEPAPRSATRTGATWRSSGACAASPTSAGWGRSGARAGSSPGRSGWGSTSSTSSGSPTGSWSRCAGRGRS